MVDLLDASEGHALEPNLASEDRSWDVVKRLGVWQVAGGCIYCEASASASASAYAYDC